MEQPQELENGKGSKEFREGYDAGYSGKARNNPYDNTKNHTATPEQQNDWTTGHVYGKNASWQNKPHMFKNAAFQNGCSKALAHIQNKADEAGVKLENMKSESQLIRLIKDSFAPGADGDDYSRQEMVESLQKMEGVPPQEAKRLLTKAGIR